MIDMKNRAHRARVALAVQHHVNMIENGDNSYFKQGPFNEDDLAQLAHIAADIYDVDLLITSLPNEDRIEAINGIQLMFAALWAAGFKAGADLYNNQP